MGISLMGSAGHLAIDPNPHKFRVYRGWDHPRLQAGGSTVCVLVVDYPGCTNYEGRKCLVCLGTVADFTQATLRELDPHFRPGGPVLARFEPTFEGVGWARRFATLLQAGS